MIEREDTHTHTQKPSQLMIIAAELGPREPELHVLPTAFTSSQPVLFHGTRQRAKWHSLSLVPFLPVTGRGSGCWHSTLLSIVRSHPLRLAREVESWHCPAGRCLRQEAEEAGSWQANLLPLKLGTSGRL